MSILLSSSNPLFGENWNYYQTIDQTIKDAVNNEIREETSLVNIYIYKFPQAGRHHYTLFFCSTRQ